MYGQKGSLIPLDSSNYVILGDSLIDIYKGMAPDTLFRFDPENLKYCPCWIDNVDGVISFKSSSFFSRYNTCFYIYLKEKEYFIRVGRRRNRKGDHSYHYQTVSIKESVAKKIIQDFKTAISEAQLPRYSSWKEYPIVEDGTTYVFGDLEKQKFGIAPLSSYSALVSSIIKESIRLVQRNIK